MDKDKSIKLFEQKTIRTHWDEEQEKWFFSIQDVEVSTLSRHIFFIFNEPNIYT